MKEIEIPEGYKARIEGNKVILELKEREDEKIRKEIIEFLTDGIWIAKEISKVRETQKYAKWIAYLEKKKESKSACSNMIRKYLEERLRGLIGKEGEYYRGAREELAHLFYILGGQPLQYLINGVAKKEQKSAEWDDKDLPQGGEPVIVDRILHSLELYREMLKDSDFEEDYVKTTINNCLEDEKWLASLRTSQKPAKCSEDEKIRAEIVDFISRNAERGDDIMKSTEWIAYLEEQKEQKPAEWSEEDETYLGIAINTVISAFGEDSHTVSWLKSLRPQQKVELNDKDKTRFMSCLLRLRTNEGVDTKNSKWFETRFTSLCTQPHWKPSEEQMQALAWYSGNSGVPPTGDKAIKSLYNDLQKLL